MTVQYYRRRKKVNGEYIDIVPDIARYAEGLADSTHAVMLANITQKDEIDSKLIKANQSSVGSSNQPIYLDKGEFKECSNIPGVSTNNTFQGTNTFVGPLMAGSKNVGDKLTQFDEDIEYIHADMSNMVKKVSSTAQSVSSQINFTTVPTINNKAMETVEHVTTLDAQNVKTGNVAQNIDGDKSFVKAIHGQTQASREGEAVLLGADGRVPAHLLEGTEWTFAMDFSPETLATDPKGALSYAMDCAGYLPVDNTGSTTMKSANLNSWKHNNPMFKGCYYCTINSNGVVSHILDTNDLTVDEDGEDVSEIIKTEDVMFCIPKRYVERTASHLVMSDQRHGTEYSCLSHTIENREYDNLYIGVYPTSVSNGVAYSRSGAVPARKANRASFRAYSNAKNTANVIVGRGLWMQWNWHHYALLRDMSLFAMKNFNSQAQLGQGYTTDGGDPAYQSHLTGKTDKLGMFAGNVGGTDTNNDVKCFVESLWGNSWQFIDDLDVNPGFVVPEVPATEETPLIPQHNSIPLYAGTNHPANIVCENATPSVNNANKQFIGEIHPPALATGSASSTLYAKAINTTPYGWGLPLETGGDANKGVCDNCWTCGGETTCRVPLVGGGSDGGSRCGLFALAVFHSLSDSAWYYGSRLAFLK